MFITVLTAVAVFTLPGFIFAALTGMRLPAAAGVALPTSFGIYGLLAWLAGAVGVDFDYGFVIGGCIGFYVLAVAWSATRLWWRLRAQSRSDAGRSSIRDSLAATAHSYRDNLRSGRAVNWILPAFGVGLGSWLMIRRALELIEETLHGTSSIIQGWDAQWHVNSLRFIQQEHVASPTRMGEMLNYSTHATQFYPTAWHAGGYAFMETAGLEPIEAATYTSVVLPALGFTIAASYLAWRACRSAGVGAALAAGIAPLFIYSIPPNYWLGFYIGAWPYTAGVGLAIIAACAFMSVPRYPRRAFATAVAFLGAAQMHSSVVTITIALVACYWLFDLLIVPSRRPRTGRAQLTQRLADLGMLAATGGVAALVLLPQILVGLHTTEEVEAFTSTFDVDRYGSWLNAALLHTRHTELFDTNWVLIWLALAGGIAVLIWKRAVWAIAAYALLLALTTHAFLPFETMVGDWLQTVVGLHYNSPHRLVMPVGVFIAAGAGVAIAAAVRLVSLAPVAAWLRRKEGGHPGSVQRAKRWAVASTMMSLVLAAPASTAAVKLANNAVNPHAQMRGDRWAILSAYMPERMVTQYDRGAYEWLAQQPRAYDGLIVGDPSQGSGWMYAYNNLPSLHKHYQWPAKEAEKDINTITWFPNLVGAGTTVSPDEENEVDELVKKFNVTYYISSPPEFWGFQQPHLRLDHGSWEAPGLTPVYKDHDVVIWAVNAAFTDKQLEELRRNSKLSPEKLPELPTRVDDDGTEHPYFHRPSKPNTDTDHDPYQLSTILQGWLFDDWMLADPPRSR